MIKTYIVYLPTGAIFIKASGYIKHEGYCKEVEFYIIDDFGLQFPVAHFDRTNIYEWSEYHG